MSQHLLARAWRAYLASDGLAAQQPDGHSTVETINGLVYAVLRNGSTVLATYRFLNHGRLRRMRRPPAALGAVTPSAAANKQSNGDLHA